MRAADRSAGPSRPIRLPFTNIHSHLLAKLQPSNISSQFTTRATVMVNLSLSKLSEHGAKAGRNDCVQA